MSNRRHLNSNNSHLRPDSLSYSEFVTLIANNGIMQTRPLNGWTRSYAYREDNPTACEICNKDLPPEYVYEYSIKVHYIKHEFWLDTVYACDVCSKFMCTPAINLTYKEVLYDALVRHLRICLYASSSWVLYGDMFRFLPSIVMTHYFGPIELYRIQKAGVYRIIGNFLGKELLDQAGQPISAETIRGTIVKILDAMTLAFRESKETQGNYQHIPAMQEFFGRFCDFALKDAGRQYEVYVVRAEQEATSEAARFIGIAFENAEMRAERDKINTIKRMMRAEKVPKKPKVAKVAADLLDNDTLSEVAPASDAVN